MHTLLLNGPTGRESLNYLYTVPMTASVLAHTEDFNSSHTAGETINNIYDLPSLERTFQYLHATAGFPTIATWLKSIRNGKYLNWPLLTINNVNRRFPESKDIQKVHMRNQRQGVRSTKAKALHPVIKSPPAEKIRDVFINVYATKGAMYTDQTGNLPHRFSQGNRYQIILHEIDGKSTWIEPMKNKTEGGIILAWRRTLQRMKSQGIVTTHQVLDNEISTAYRLETKQTITTYQLVPPDDHWRNLAYK